MPADSPPLNGDLAEGKCNALTISACDRKLLNSLSGTWQQKTDLASERTCQWKPQMIAVLMPCFLFSLYLELFSRLRAHKFCALCVSGHSCVVENAKHWAWMDELQPFIHSFILSTHSLRWRGVSQKAVHSNIARGWRKALPLQGRSGAHCTSPCPLQRDLLPCLNYFPRTVGTC